MRSMIVAAATLALCCGVSALAQEKKLKKSELPVAVQKAVDEQSQGATIQGYAQETENGKVAYEVQLTVNGHSKDITMDSQGKVMEIEEEVDLKALPTEVRAGLEKQAGQGVIGKVESLTKYGSLVAYEAQVRAGTHRSEIQVGPNGQRLQHKE